jgi:hypothetical protein
MNRRPFSELRSRLEAKDPQWAAEQEARVEKLREYQRSYERRLGDLRRAVHKTQVVVARELGVSQAQISRIENQQDLYLSTLRDYVAALGGQLELVVTFGEERVTVDLGELVEPEPQSVAVAA